MTLAAMPPHPPPPDDAVAAAFAAARDHLACHDLDAWQRALNAVAAADDRHRRYAARKGILATALDWRGQSRRPPAAAAAERLLAVARAGVGLLEEEPREPVFLNLTGVALFELGAWESAEALFTAAVALSPALPHAGANRDAARARLAGGSVAPPLARPVRAALAALAPRAADCAAGARPVEGLTLSLCMIARDEEEMLPRSLAAARDAVDEIVLVDTGSVDRTVEIARSFGARVIKQPWNGSFADARNVALDAATGDWLLVLDADEVLVEGDGPRLRALTGRIWREAFYLVLTNHTGEVGDGTAVTHNALRMFRNRPEHRYEGRIHEQIAHTLPAGLPERLEASDARVEHFGYLGAVRNHKDKARRNIELLRRQQEEGEDSAFLHFNLGSEHAAADDAAQACAAFERAWELLRDDPAREAYGFVPALVARLVRARRLTGRPEDAIALADEALAFLPGFTDLVFEQGLAARALGDTARAARLLERCVAMGDAPSRYAATAGTGGFLALVALADLRQATGDAPGALATLRRCLVEHPRYAGAVRPYAEAVLASGTAAHEVEAAVGELLGELGLTARFLLAIALYEAGHPAAAEPHLRAVVRAQPRSSGARVALAESLLSQRRWGEAAAEAAAVPAGDPHAGAARRTELFARIVLGDLDGARDVAAAARGDMAPGELEAYQTWTRAAAGSAAATLTAEGALSLAVALEALLRVREVDAAGPLVALLERSPLSARDRHELLAGVYLRRGFLESAADEWVAACQATGVDARALVGLARVARARGLLDDALTLAREAAVLDPAFAAGPALVAELQEAIGRLRGSSSAACVRS